jgi:hypothetical protein
MLLLFLSYHLRNRQNLRRRKLLNDLARIGFYYLNDGLFSHKSIMLFKLCDVAAICDHIDLFLLVKLKHKVFWETFGVPFHSPVQCTGFYAV